MTIRNLPTAILTPVCVTLLVGIVAFHSSVRSVPRFSAEQGLECAECHLAPGGGAMRNEYGHYTMSVNELTLVKTKEKLLKSYKAPRLSEGALIGADLRWQGSRDGSFKRYQTNFYLSYEPFAKTYLNLNFTGSGIDESYLLVTNTKNTAFTQLGKMYAPFGLRYEYQSAFIGASAGYPHGKSVEGVLVGGRALGHSAQIFAFNGPGHQNVIVGNLARYGWLGPVSYMYGGSYSRGEKLSGSYGSFKPAIAGYGGVGFRGHSVLYELDVVGEDNNSYATLAAVTFRVMQGIWIHGDYNFLEPDRKFKSGVSEFIRAGFDFWPMPFVELSPAVIAHTQGADAGKKEYELLAHFAF